MKLFSGIFTVSLLLALSNAQPSNIQDGRDYDDCEVNCITNPNDTSSALIDGVVCRQSDVPAHVSDFTVGELEAFQTARDNNALDTCLCGWDEDWTDLSHPFASDPLGKCVDFCNCDEVKAKTSTAQPPKWNLDESGFIGPANTFALAVDRSTCYDSAEYAYGDQGEIADSDWEQWNYGDTDVVYKKNEDCWVTVRHDYTWWEDKNTTLRTKHDDNSPLFLGELANNDTAASIPMTLADLETYLASRDASNDYYSTFVVYDGCLNIREETSFPFEFDGTNHTIDRHVTNVMKFKVILPIELQICANVTVDVVNMEEVLVNQTAYCTEDGFGAEVDFRTFTTSPFKVNETSSSYDVTYSGPHSANDCLQVSLAPQNNTGSCANDNSTCIQDWTLTITPNTTEACKDTCDIKGVYTFDVSLVHQDTTGNYVSYNESFSFTLDSADFCPQVVAEATIEGDMEAYRLPNRTVQADAFITENMIYLKAEFDSPDATIQDVEPLLFTVQRVGGLSPGQKHVLWNDSVSDVNPTTYGSTVSFQFMTIADTNSSNPFYLYPQFNITGTAFGLNTSGLTFPVTLEMCLTGNVTFWGSENDGSNGDGLGGSTGPSLLEMIDRTNWATAEVRRSLILLENGEYKFIDQDEVDMPLRADEVVDDEPEKNTSSEKVLNITIISFLITILITVGAYAAFVIVRQKKYEKVPTRVSSRSDVTASA